MCFILHKSQYLMICLQSLFLKSCSDVHWCALTWDLQLQCVRGQTDDRTDETQLWLSFLAQTNSILIHNHPQTVIQQTLGSQWPLCHLLGQSQQQSTCHENWYHYINLLSLSTQNDNKTAFSTSTDAHDLTG